MSEEQQVTRLVRKGGVHKLVNFWQCLNNQGDTIVEWCKAFEMLCCQWMHLSQLSTCRQSISLKTSESAPETLGAVLRQFLVQNDLTSQGNHIEKLTLQIFSFNF